MNFQDLQKIEESQDYVEHAFKKSKRVGEAIYPRTSGDRFYRIRKTEIEKLRTFGKTIDEDLSLIIKKFPSIDSLPEFYVALIQATLDYDMLKKSLGSLQWCVEHVDTLTKTTIHMLTRAQSEESIKKIMGAYYGRCSSFLKRISRYLIYLEQARLAMKDYPTLKTELFTVAITGFPNIGKSTLLSKLTPARPEIKNYSFTTKKLNLGYAMYDIKKVQFVDTPGVLSRDKKNPIEEQAYLVLKYLVHLIVYVVDLTEPYPLAMQKKLLKELKDYEKPIIVYLSKTDVLPAAVVAKAKKTFSACITLEALNKKIEKELHKHYFE